MCETPCAPQQQEQGLLGTTNAKLHCCCCWCCTPVLLLLWFGHTHAHKNCASDLWVEGIHTYHVEGHTTQSRLRSKQALTSTVVSQRQSADSEKQNYLHSTTTSGDSPQHQQGLGRPLWRRLSECPSCKSRLPMRLARATSRHVCFLSRQAARS